MSLENARALELLGKYHLPLPIQWPQAIGKTIARIFAEKTLPNRWYFLLNDGCVLCFHRHIFGEDSSDLSCFRPGIDTSECSRSECVPTWRDYFSDLKENDFPGAADALREWEDMRRVWRNDYEERRQRMEYEKLKAKFEKP